MHGCTGVMEAMNGRERRPNRESQYRHSREACADMALNLELESICTFQHRMDSGSPLRYARNDFLLVILANAEID